MTIADPKEVKTFLEKHPEIQFFEILFTNMAGVPRGKRLRRHEIEAVYAQGRCAEALELSARAEAVSPSVDLLAQTSWRQLRAKAWARAGALDEGQRLATDAVRLIEVTDALNERASALLDLAETLHLADEHDRAGADVAKALELFAAKGNLQAARGARTRFAELAVAAAS